MRYIYRNLHLPEGCPALSQINAAAEFLCSKLKGLDIGSLPISNYNRRYLNEHIRSLHGVLMRHTYILALAIGNTSSLRRFTIVDYGGGSGLLSLLAKQTGIGTVIYNDIYDVSCSDARIIAESIGIEADIYINGELEDVMEFLQKENRSCNAIASHDVIEHIYNTEGFFANLHQLSTSALTVVMATGTNSLNPRIRRRKRKMHIEAEFAGKKEVWGHKERDTKRPFFEVRKEIISKYAPDLTSEEMYLLASATRGLIDSDIKIGIDQYRNSGVLPKGTKHPSNTCDPYTGNWEERLLYPYHLVEILRKTGFSSKVILGYYGMPRNPLKRLLADSLNVAIYLMPSHGIRIAPFIAIYGKNS